MEVFVLVFGWFSFWEALFRTPASWGRFGIIHGILAGPLVLGGFSLPDSAACLLPPAQHLRHGERTLIFLSHRKTLFFRHLNRAAAFCCLVWFFLNAQQIAVKGML